MNERIRLRQKVLDRPEKEQYILLQSENGARLFRHLLVDDTTAEFLLLEKTGTILLTVFREIRILPSLHEADLVYRKKLMPGVKTNKNPDFRIDDFYWELENPSYPYSYKKIDQRIRKGYQQADSMILYFQKPVNGFTVQKAIRDRFGIKKDFKEAIIIVGNKIIGHLKK